MQSKVVGILGFSYAQRKVEPNPCNVNLANSVVIAARMAKQEGLTPVVAVQWEIGLALKSLRFTPDFVVQQRNGYLDTAGVIDGAAAHFKHAGAKRIIPIAHRFLHLHRCKSLLKKKGFEVQTRIGDMKLGDLIGPIGFDPESEQWWTRNRWSSLCYAIRQGLTGAKGA